MSQIPFSTDWLKRFSDPYAVLGLSVSADDRRVLKRYRTVAKLLHPDGYVTADPADRELASQLFAHLISPAYQKLKQDKDRAESLALLRVQVRRNNREEPSSPQSGLAQQLLKTPMQSVDVFYEQAIAQLADSQYQPLRQFELITQQLIELNLVYLQLKMGEPVRPKATGLVPAEQIKREAAAAGQKPPQPTVNYAQRHYLRAHEYMKKESWSMAVQELRDAIRLEPTKNEFHSLLAKAYFMQNLTGMATVHFRQALKLNPQDPLALEYAKKLKIKLEPPNTDKKGGLFGLFAKKR
ncbi:MAG: DnaJ domain-containing protein [Leptolyngbyaceae cyanobacterium SL_5_9]|nr:DnaJ domain-containing protein [Leptolyngbyaceae cyanobacterium SL_5_9]